MGYSYCWRHNAWGVRWDKDVAKAWNMLLGKTSKSCSSNCQHSIYLQFSRPRRSSSGVYSSEQLGKAWLQLPFCFTSLFVWSISPPLSTKRCKEERLGFESDPWFLILVLPSCVTQGKSLNLSKLRFPHLYNGIMNTCPAYLTVLK